MRLKKSCNSAAEAGLPSDAALGQGGKSRRDQNHQIYPLTVADGYARSNGKGAGELETRLWNTVEWKQPAQYAGKPPKVTNLALSY